MKGLHQFQVQAKQHYWFGDMYPCADAYHVGYESERTDSSSHAQCAVNLASTANERLGYAERCRCRTCRDQHASSHYFGAPSYDDMMASNYDENEDNFYCSDCMTGAHPVPPPPGDNVH